MRVALVHDHLAQDGGAEKVLKVFTDLFPSAPIYTLLYEKNNADKNFKDKRIETSIIQKLPGGVRHYKWYLPFMPMAVEFFDLSGYDLVISDASAFAKGVITSTETLHICYCHTPTRYLWSDTHQYIKELGYNKYLKKVISYMLSSLRLWDRLAADRVDSYIANSQFIAQRIKKYYHRDSVVIYPPVETGNFEICQELGDYFLIGGRLAPYKRVDIVIEAFVKTGKKLKVFGDGIDMARLRKMAAGHDNIEFIGRVDDKEKAVLYSKCLAFINPQEEDFGITAVEAMASGRPVIALCRGGAKETIIGHETGEFFYEQTAQAIVSVLNRFDHTKYDPQKIRQHALSFSRERFMREIKLFIEKEYQNFSAKVCKF